MYWAKKISISLTVLNFYLTILYHWSLHSFNCFRIYADRRCAKTLITFNIDSAISEIRLPLFNLCNTHSSISLLVSQLFLVVCHKFSIKFYTDYLLNMFCNFEYMHTSDGHRQHVWLITVAWQSCVLYMLANNHTYTLWSKVIWCSSVPLDSNVNHQHQ